MEISGIQYESVQQTIDESRKVGAVCILVNGMHIGVEPEIADEMAYRRVSFAYLGNIIDKNGCRQVVSVPVN